MNPQRKIVDYLENKKNLFKVLGAPFLAQKITVDTNRTYTDSKFTFSLTLANTLPRPNAYI